VRARVCFPQRSACLGKTEERKKERRKSVFESSETLKIIKLGKLKIHEKVVKNRRMSSLPPPPPPLASEENGGTNDDDDEKKNDADEKEEQDGFFSTAAAQRSSRDDDGDDDGNEDEEEEEEELTAFLPPDDDGDFPDDVLANNEKKKKTTTNHHQNHRAAAAAAMRAMTPGPLSIERPECTLRRRANVSRDAKVKELLAKLDEERKEAEKRGDFERCNEISIAMERTKKEEEKRRVNLVAVHHQKAMADAIEVQKKTELDLKRRHEREAMKMKESFHAESEKLKETRMNCFENFEKECNGIRSRAQKRKPKARAKELSEIRNIQDALTKQKKYIEAQEVRQKGDAIERKARNETNRMIENDIMNKKSKMKEKFEREEKQMKIKQNCCAKVLRRRHEEELVGLERKFRGIFNELENVSKVEMREMNVNTNVSTSSSSASTSGVGGSILRPNLNCSTSSGNGHRGAKAHFAC